MGALVHLLPWRSALPVGLPPSRKTTLSPGCYAPPKDTLRDTLEDRPQIRDCCILESSMGSGCRGRNLDLEHSVHGIETDLYEATTHAFVIKIWLEETAEEAGHATWRGHITHVPSGTRRYVQDLNDITGFIAPRLEEMGVNVGLIRRVRQWLER